jgi:hypothetical protein
VKSWLTNTSQKGIAEDFTADQPIAKIIWNARYFEHENASYTSLTVRECTMMNQIQQ